MVGRGASVGCRPLRSLCAVDRQPCRDSHFRLSLAYETTSANDAKPFATLR